MRWKLNKCNTHSITWCARLTGRFLSVGRMILIFLSQTSDQIHRGPKLILYFAADSHRTRQRSNFSDSSRARSSTDFSPFTSGFKECNKGGIYYIVLVYYRIIRWARKSNTEISFELEKMWIRSILGCIKINRNTIWRNLVSLFGKNAKVFLSITAVGERERVYCWECS